jgi:hypothetical protein
VSFESNKDKQGAFVDFMGRPHVPLPPLWHLETQLQLTDQFPSGLQWACKTGWHAPGEMAGKYVPSTRYYVVRLGGERYLAHRIVYFLRTSQDPEGADVIHTCLNRDNRKELTLRYRTHPSTNLTLDSN